MNDQYLPGYVSVRGGVGFTLGERYTSTDYADCYLDFGEFDALAGTGKTRGQFAYLMHWINACIGVRPHRHNRAHANKLARHAKRPNGRPRFR